MNHKLSELSQEIHRRRSFEREIESQREWLRVTLASIGDAVIATDVRGEVTLMNSEAERLTGWTAQDAIGKPLTTVFRIINESTRRVVESPVEKVFREGRVVGLANHTVLVARQGSERPIDDSAAPILDADKALIGVVLVFHDVTEHRRLEQELRSRNTELEETSNRKDEFLAMLAHELRNPLASIRTAAALLERSYGDLKTLSAASGVIDRQSKHLAALVDDLLDVSRVTSGKVLLRLECVDLRKMVERCGADFSHRCEAAAITRAVTLPDEPVWVDADATRICQVIDNLLDNACKFTEPGGHVRLELNRNEEAGMAVLSVTDDGVGMEPQMVERLFMPFVQADQTLDRAKGGLGLGLALVKGLTELHHGDVSATSSGQGLGSQFTLRLPLTVAPINTTGVSREGSESGGCRVLIIEDNRDAADILALLIGVHGNQVTIARSGAEGLEIAIRDRPHVVICDIGLPGMSGLEVAAQLRGRPEFSKTRLIALSGYGQEADRQRSLEAGFDCHLTKPADSEQLLKELTPR